MRANDISRRIARMYAALGTVVSDNLEDVTVEMLGFGTNGLPLFRLNPQGNYSQADLEYAAASSVHSVANYFDHCVAASRSLGIPKEEVFKVTERCLSLLILRDLDNKDKHPAAAINSSGVFPELSDVQRALRIVGSKDNPGKLQYTFTPGSKQITVLEQHQVDVVITGTVKNAKTGETLAPLHGLLEEGVYEWEKFLLSYRADITLGFIAIAEKIFFPSQQ